MNRREPFGQARLVGVPDHRRVEQGRRFERVFLSEIGADQQLPALADRQVGQQVRPDLLEAVEEELARALVPLAELPHHFFEQASDLRLSERGETRAMIFSTRLLVRQLERPDDDAGVDRFEDDPGSLDIHVRKLRSSLRELLAVLSRECEHYRAWRNAARELSSRFISASESRKARVDSAPGSG